ncbi:MAG: ATP phosphoribosyltransferase regulatory subunit [Hyphomicrobium sp.]
MAAESAKKFEALEAQAQKLIAVFTKAGYEAVAPAIIQPAGVFLDVIGETLRARTYVFNDPDGDELCLRPDITVPIGRLHLERFPVGNAKGRYCYNGTAFRFQPVGADKAHPREFRQAGIESIGSTEREKAEAQTVATIIEALKVAGLYEFRLRIGDLGLLRALLKAAEMPDRWRQRLLHHFWRPDAFRAELKRLTTEPAQLLRNIPAELLAGIDPGNRAASEQALAAYLDQHGIEHVGARSLAEIAANLSWLAADAKSEPLSVETAAKIESYLGVTAPARAAGARLKDMVRASGLDMSVALESYHKRLQLLTEAGVDVVHADFSAEFGRTLEYYTGFVFEIVAPTLGPQTPVAGGGRYDSLMKAIGAPDHVPAVGAAIHTERLLAAVTGDKI